MPLKSLIVIFRKINISEETLIDGTASNKGSKIKKTIQKGIRVKR